MNTVAEHDILRGLERLDRHLVAIRQILEGTTGVRTVPVQEAGELSPLRQLALGCQAIRHRLEALAASLPAEPAVNSRIQDLLEHVRRQGQWVQQLGGEARVVNTEMAPDVAALLTEIDKTAARCGHSHGGFARGNWPTMCPECLHYLRQNIEAVLLARAGGGRGDG